MDDPKVVFARLPAAMLRHPVKLKELRTQWDLGCSKILQDAKLTPDQRIKVGMGWLSKAGIRDFVLGKLVLSFARPLPIPPTEEQRKERRQKTFVRMAYEDDIPHLRAVNTVVSNRLENIKPEIIDGSLRSLDSVDDREVETPGAMFAEFARSIEEQVVLEYKHKSAGPFEHAAE